MPELDLFSEPEQVTELKMRDREAAIARKILLAEAPIA